MKNLDLDQTWELCLEMWKWIAEVWDDGRNIEWFKEEWMEENGFGRDVGADCFFCNFIDQLGMDFEEIDHGCVYCPGRLIDDSFSCSNPKYDYEDNPVKFYQELVRLDKIRESMKG